MATEIAKFIEQDLYPEGSEEVIKALENLECLDTYNDEPIIITTTNQA